MISLSAVPRNFIEISFYLILASASCGAKAACLTTMVPTMIVTRSGGLDVAGTVATTSCTCATPGFVAFDINVSETQVSRWMSILVTARITESSVQIASYGTCAAGWFTTTQDRGYSVTLM